MPRARPTPVFQQWVETNFDATQRDAITARVQDLDDYGLLRKDPDLIKLDLSKSLTSAQFGALTVAVFILPQRISRGLRRATPVWFGLVEFKDGPWPGMLLLTKGWTRSPVLELVRAERDIANLAEQALA
jgi:hypothetical protein